LNGDENQFQKRGVKDQKEENGPGGKKVTGMEKQDEI